MTTYRRWYTLIYNEGDEGEWKMRNWFKKSHPEQGDNEVFLTNAKGHEDYDRIGWNTKRAGKTAYNTSGFTVEGMFPVFVTQKELIDADIINEQGARINKI